MDRASFSNILFVHEKQEKVGVIMLFIVPILMSLLIYRYHCQSKSVNGSGNYFVRSASLYNDCRPRTIFHWGFQSWTKTKVKVTSISAYVCYLGKSTLTHSRALRFTESTSYSPSFSHPAAYPPWHVIERLPPPHPTADSLQCELLSRKILITEVIIAAWKNIAISPAILFLRPQ